MSNYRRLISYVYTYEGNVKGKNVGFVKLEARNGQCKISVNVKKVFVSSSDMGVYLLAPGKEIFLGSIFIRGGAGEFRAILSSENAAGSGFSINGCYGLTIHETDSSWLAYTTIWEDAVTHAAEVELADLTSEKYGAKEEENLYKIESRLKKELEEEIFRQNMQEALQKQAAEVVNSQSEEVKREEIPAEKLPEERSQMEEIHLAEQKENQAVSREEIQQETVEVRENRIAEAAPVQAEAPEEIEMVNQENIQEARQEAGAVRTRVFIYRSGKNGQAELQPETEFIQETENEAYIEKMEESQEQVQPVIHQEEPNRPMAGNPADLTRLEIEEKEEEMNQGRLWEFFQKNYPKIQAFESEHGGEILSIKPQDLGLLPREIWVYGNNSFLLHSYYNYRYLILARLANPGGQPRFLLGVPGHYYNNEKYMASMFGFPHFVLSKKQPSDDGRFGYWYTDVRIQA